jgi:hypothetical protein
LQSCELSTDIQQLADDAVTYHRARWSAHHLQFPTEAVCELAASWLAGGVLPDIAEEQVLQPDLQACRFDVWAILTRFLLTEPSNLTRMASLTDDEVSTYVPGASAADVAYFTGDIERAQMSYLGKLQRLDGYDDPHEIVGLGLSMHDGLARQRLLSQPHLYRAVQRQIVARTGNPADPLQLIQWLNSERTEVSMSEKLPGILGGFVLKAGG